MAIRTAVRELRRNLSDLIGRVHYSDETVIIERFGKPMVAMIPLDLYERMVEEREARFAVVDRLRDRLPDLSPDEVEQDVRAAVEAVRTSADA